MVCQLNFATQFRIAISSRSCSERSVELSRRHKNKELAASWRAKKLNAGKRRQTKTEQVRYPREDYRAFIFTYPDVAVPSRCAHVYKSIGNVYHYNIKLLVDSCVFILHCVRWSKNLIFCDTVFICHCSHSLNVQDPNETPFSIVFISPLQLFNKVIVFDTVFTIYIDYATFT